MPVSLRPPCVPIGYFLPFGGIVVLGARLLASCLDFAAAASFVVAAAFCLLPRSFDFGDLSPTLASVRSHPAQASQPRA